MDPNFPEPVGITDEVGVIIGDTEVVAQKIRCVCQSGVDDFIDPYPFAFQRSDFIYQSQIGGLCRVEPSALSKVPVKEI